MKYKVEVVETRTYRVTYVVEADSSPLAHEKAMRGETEEERDPWVMDITDRSLWSLPEEIPEKATRKEKIETMVAAYQRSKHSTGPDYSLSGIMGDILDAVEKQK